MSIRATNTKVKISNNSTGIQTQKHCRSPDYQSEQHVSSIKCVFVIAWKKYVGETGRTIHFQFPGCRQNIFKHQNGDCRWDSVQVPVLKCHPDWTQDLKRWSERDGITGLQVRYRSSINERMFFHPWGSSLTPSSSVSSPNLDSVLKLSALGVLD